MKQLGKTIDDIKDYDSWTDEEREFQVLVNKHINDMLGDATKHIRSGNARLHEFVLAGLLAVFQPLIWTGNYRLQNHGWNPDIAEFMDNHQINTAERFLLENLHHIKCGRTRQLHAAALMADYEPEILDLWADEREGKRKAEFFIKEMELCDSKPP